MKDIELKDNMNIDCDYKFDYVIIGDAGVGKSALMTKFTQDRFSDARDPTIGLEYGEKIIVLDNKKIRIQIFDTAGQEVYRSITRSYYRNRSVALIVFDITDIDTFKNVEYWINEIETYDMVKILVGNKIDLDGIRKVPFRVGYNMAKKYDIKYLETSSKSDINIENVFNNIVFELYRKKKELGTLDENKEEPMNYTNVFAINGDFHQSESYFNCCWNR